MRLYFIRHAQSANNALYDNSGSEDGRNDDPVLSPIGEQQARRLGDFLELTDDPLEQNGIALTHLYCSAMVRAIHTATEVSRGTRLTPVIWEDWHETGGVWLEQNGVRVGIEGKNRAALSSLYPNVRLPDAYGENGWWSREYEEDPHPRAQRAWKELLERHGGTMDRVAIVSHGHFFAHVMSVALNAEIGSGKNWFVTNNTGITRFDLQEDMYQSTRVVYQNRLSHLPLELIT